MQENPYFDGAPEGIRTPDPQNRSHVLDPDTTGHSPTLTAKTRKNSSLCGLSRIVADVARHAQTHYLCYPAVTRREHQMARALTTRAVETTSPGKRGGSFLTGTCRASIS